MNEEVKEQNVNAKKDEEALWEKLTKIGPDFRKRLSKLYHAASLKSRRGSVYFAPVQDGSRLDPAILTYTELNTRSYEKFSDVLRKRDKASENCPIRYTAQYYPFDAVFTEDGWYGNEGKMKTEAGKFSLEGIGETDYATMTWEEILDYWDSPEPITLIYKNIGVDFDAKTYSESERPLTLKKLGLYTLVRENLITVENMFTAIIFACVAGSSGIEEDLDDEEMQLQSVRVGFTLNFSSEEYIKGLEKGWEKDRKESPNH